MAHVRFAPAGVAFSAESQRTAPVLGSTGRVPPAGIEREPVREPPIILCESGVCPLREMRRRLPQKYGCGSGCIQGSGQEVRQAREAERAARAGVGAAAVSQVTPFSTE